MQTRTNAVKSLHGTTIYESKSYFTGLIIKMEHYACLCIANELLNRCGFYRGPKSQWPIN